VGPVQTDFHKFVSGAQGSMGIVTWGTVRCEVIPQVHRFFFIPSKKLEDIIDFTYKMLRFRFGDELLILNASNLASILSPDAVSIGDLAAELPPWVVLVGIAGRNVLPLERVEYQEKDISDMAQQFGLELVPEILGARNKDIMTAILNPSQEPYWKVKSQGGCQDIFFITTLEKSPEFIKTMYAMAEQVGYPTSDIGIYIQPVHQGTSCHCEFNIPYDPGKMHDTNRAKDLYVKASEALFRQGAFFSRPYDIWAPMAYNQDMQTTIVLKKIKDIFDPNNVMNPGKLCF
jgi:FAD/FMN-containing dehydrogenase